MAIGGLLCEFYLLAHWALGLIPRCSYVDHQLRRSRRFDAEGIERDHPELFVPFPRRRSSSNNSLSSMGSSSAKEYFLTPDEGQLRYWTSDMCSQSPHLFDFVVTVSVFSIPQNQYKV